MKIKRIVGIVILIVGIAGIFYAVSSMNKIKTAKGEVQGISGAISGSTWGNMAGKEMGKEASQYDTEVMLLLIGSIVLVVIGGGLSIFCKKKR